jgi:hypothetical protein
MPRRENRATPKVIRGILYGAQSFPVESPAWWAWLTQGEIFYVEMLVGGYTARCEQRRGLPFWYAFKTVEGKQYKVYLGRTNELTAERLSAAARQLEAKIAQRQGVFTEPSHQ